MTEKDIQGRRFDPVGRCIYCCSDGGSRGLSEEHIMAYSLNGNAVLPAASCADCEAITSYLDGYLARSVFYEYRLHTGAQSRTPSKKRPQKRTALIRRGDRLEEREFPVGDHPFSVVLPLLGLPGFLSGIPLTPDFASHQAHAFHMWPPGFQDEMRGEENERVSLITMGVPNLDTFARAIAKIGYCHAVAHHHVEPDRTLPISRYIRGEDNRLGPYLVGYDEREQEGPSTDPSVMHRVRLYRDNLQDRSVLVASVRLFANSGTPDKGMPTYIVAISEVPLD
jgi:hypothetical protein